jgi:hypothetical protein
MNVSVDLSKCKGKFRLELLLRSIRGPGISLSWCLFFLTTFFGQHVGYEETHTLKIRTDIASGVLLEEQIYVCGNKSRHPVCLNVHDPTGY